MFKELTNFLFCSVLVFIYLFENQYYICLYNLCDLYRHCRCQANLHIYLSSLVYVQLKYKNTFFNNVYDVKTFRISQLY